MGRKITSQNQRGEKALLIHNLYFQFVFFGISIVILQFKLLSHKGENFKQRTSASKTTTSLCISESVFLDLQADRVKEDSSCALIVLGSSHCCGRKDIVPKCGIGLNNCKHITLLAQTSRWVLLTYCK